jgi:F-type H+-transporting ATPase subunit a
MLLPVQDVAAETAKLVQHHIMDAPSGIPGVTRLSVTLIIAGALLFTLARAGAKVKNLRPAGVLQNFFEGVVLFVRDELVRPAMGHHGDKLVPFFCTLFTLVLTCNLFGMVPFDVVTHAAGGTVTSNMGMTLFLAALVLLVGIVYGIKENGPGVMFHAFVPPGLPKLLIPVLYVLEFGGFLIRHLVLAVRLCINMTAGHLVIGGFFSMIFIAKAWGAAVPAVGLALFMSLLEILFCVIQAYVFTLLSVLFVGGLVHPDH